MHCRLSRILALCASKHETLLAVMMYCIEFLLEFYGLISLGLTVVACLLSGALPSDPEPANLLHCIRGGGCLHHNSRRCRTGPPPPPPPYLYIWYPNLRSYPMPSLLSLSYLASQKVRRSEGLREKCPAQSAHMLYPLDYLSIQLNSSIDAMVCKINQSSWNGFRGLMPRL